MTRPPPRSTLFPYPPLSRPRSATTSCPPSPSAGTRARPRKPAAPVTRTLAIEKPAAHRSELVDRAGVVVGPPDVQPISAEPAHRYGLPGGNQIEHQTVESIEPLARDVVEDAGAQHV